LDDKSLQRSGLDYHDLASVKVHENLDACLFALADSRLFAVETGGRHCYALVQYRAGDAFIFGPETRGLPNAVLDRVGCEKSLFIPMRAPSRSINLSNVVALLAYEAWRQLGFTGAATAPRDSAPSR
jgi:tRNA (cytidine/uridine-2'-O-)-methyltransferase